MKTYKILLIRHGATLGNEEGLYIGVTDLSLTTNGINEIRRLKAKKIYPDVDIVFSASQKRSRETAEIIFPELLPISIDEFNEMNFGIFEGKNIVELSDDEDYKEWVLGKTDRPKGGESFKEFAARLCVGLRRAVQYMMDNEIFSAAAVVPGGAIMTLLSVCALPKAKSLQDYSADFGKGYVISITPNLYAKSGIVEVISGIDE